MFHEAHTQDAASCACGSHGYTEANHKHQKSDTDSHESACGCEQAEEGGSLGKTLALLGVAGVLMALGILFATVVDVGPRWLSAALYGACILLAGTPVMLKGVKNLRYGKLDENLLMTIAMVAAFSLGEFFEGAAVALFFRVGELLEEYASNRSRNQIRALSQMRPDTAHLLGEDGTTQEVAAQTVAIGSKIRVLPHERIPLDGVVREGASSLDASSLTGESLPVEAEPGTAVASGMMNANGILTIETTQLFGDSSASRIIQMVEDATKNKGEAHKTITKFARIYTPVILVLAVLVFAIPSLLGQDWQEWLRRALSFLVASCPCALVLSVPLGYFAAMGAAAKQGVIVKGGVFVDAIAKASTFVFDKTGTLTTGEPQLTEIVTVDGVTQQEAHALAAACEWYSAHPLAKAIVANAPAVEESALQNFRETPGGGTSVTYEGKQLLCGGTRLMQQHAIATDGLPTSAVYLAVDGRAIAGFAFSDQLREQAKGLVARLRALGAKRFVMLTGDSAAAAQHAAKQTGIAEVKAHLLPQDKLQTVQQLKAETQQGVVFVGDGINDAPVLALADAGVAMGLGTQAASEAADVILTGSNLTRLADVRYLFRRARGIINFNIAFSLAVKAAFLLLGVLGITSISAAVFADVGILVLTVLNASRILRIRAK